MKCLILFALVLSSFCVATRIPKTLIYPEIKDFMPSPAHFQQNYGKNYRKFLDRTGNVKKVLKKLLDKKSPHTIITAEMKYSSVEEDVDGLLTEFGKRALLVPDASFSINNRVYLSHGTGASSRLIPVKGNKFMFFKSGRDAACHLLNQPELSDIKSSIENEISCEAVTSGDQ